MSDKERSVPWRDPEQWAQWIKALAGPVALITMSTLYRLYNDNDRRCIGVKQAAAELPGVIMILMLARGMQEYYDLGENATAAVMVLMAWIGPRMIVEGVKSSIAALSRYGNK